MNYLITIAINAPIVTLMIASIYIHYFKKPVADMAWLDSVDSKTEHPCVLYSSCEIARRKP